MLGSCVSVCLFVQAFSGIAPERLGRSGPARHRSTRRLAGTTMVPNRDRSVARGTCHVPPRGPLQKQRASGYRSYQWTHGVQTLWPSEHHREARALGVSGGGAPMARAVGTCQVFGRFASSARTKRPIGTGVVSFDSPSSRTNTDVKILARGGTWHVPGTYLTFSILAPERLVRSGPRLIRPNARKMMSCHTRACGTFWHDVPIVII